MALAFSSLTLSWGASAEVGLVSSVKVKPSSSSEPIAYVGHGAFFDRNGKQIVPTEEFVTKAQEWYRERLLAGLAPERRATFADFERRLGAGLTKDGQDGLVLRQRSLEWLLSVSPQDVEHGRMRAKLSALQHRLNWRLARRNDVAELQSLAEFRLDPGVAARLRQAEFTPSRPAQRLATVNSGAAYEAECTSWNVPIPPSIGVMDPLGLTGWRSVGFIPTSEQFIVGTPAEVRVFESPDGMCIALPRYTSASLTTVALDGVICLSQITSKVCFWDNSNSTTGGANFNFAAGDQIPIGAVDLSVDPSGRYQGGGAEIEFAAGGQCTDCHAGENPYIIHPNSNLGTVLFGDLNSSLGLPMFGPNRYDPIVGASWPQNALSHSQALVPSSCVGCHVQGGSGGRFPHLSNEISGYCGTILAQALSVALPTTMPPGSPGSLASDAAVLAFQAYCGTAPSAGPTNRGDPHLYTTNGIQYDFQAAGEFTSLRNSSTGFELQTRQTPVLTTWTPGPNAHTGLASCPSLNTAAAMLVNRQRVTYQPSSRGGQEMELRVDGRLTYLPPGGLDLGAGNWLYQASTGQGLDLRLDDGTRVVITPDYWSSEGYWYLNVEAFTTPAREGILGPILGSDWLPKAPNGSSFGPAPVGLLARHTRLNQTFADAWRVTNTSSLFDYAPGTSTATFTNRAWPPPPGTPCSTMPGIPPWPGHEERRPVKGMDPQVATSLCRIIEDKAVFDDCVFDLTMLGNPGMVDGFVLMMEARTP